MSESLRKLIEPHFLRRTKAMVLEKKKKATDDVDGSEEKENRPEGGARYIKVARYSFSGSIPAKFEHKLRRHKPIFGKIATTVVLDEDENLFLSGLQRHRSCHSNEMTLLPILLAAVYLGTRNCSSKIIYGSFFLQ